MGSFRLLPSFSHLKSLYQNTFWVNDIGPGVAGSISWVVDVEIWVQDPESGVLGLRAEVPILDYALQLSSYTTCSTILQI